jgi:hypothetical protein
LPFVLINQANAEKAPNTKKLFTAASLGAPYTGEISAKELLDESVKNAANETIGDINDVLIGNDGKIAAVIVGVGGFLGMGEKNVALPFDQLTFVKDEGDDPRRRHRRHEGEPAVGSRIHQARRPLVKAPPTYSQLSRGPERSGPHFTGG